MSDDNSKTMTNETMFAEVVRLKTLNEMAKEQLSSIDKKVTDINSKIDDINLIKQELVTLRREFDDYKRSASSELKDYKESRKLSSWFIPVISAVTSGVIVFLVEKAFNK